MNEAEIKALVAEILGGIAPEADLGTIGDDEDMRLALDLDSMDFLNMIVGLHERTGVEVPESDYPQLFTLAGIIDYFQSGSG
jgi:acyl carrier protein